MHHAPCTMHHVFVTTLEAKLPWRVVSMMKPKTASVRRGGLVYFKVPTTKLRRASESIRYRISVFR